MPAEYAANLDFHARLLADTLILGNDGRGEWRALIESDQPGGAPRVEHADVTYERVGNHLSVSFVCPNSALASCVAAPHFVGTVQASGLSFDESVLMRPPMVFRRAYPTAG